MLRALFIEPLNTDEWTPAELGRLRREARRLGADFDLAVLAKGFRRSEAEVNRALDALIGRKVAEAARWLKANPVRNGGGARGPFSQSLGADPAVPGGDV